jgi:hypothetical protein
MRAKPLVARLGYRRVYCRYYVHYITGRRVYPKRARYFTFLVRSK